MRNKSLACLILVAALAVLASACETIPDDKKASVSINLDLMAKPGQLPPGLEPQGPSSYKYHVKITLTNPTETFYAFDWTPPEPIGLMVASTGRRVIDVEVYYVSTSTSTNYFPASHYVTINPPEQRTVDLTGEATTVSIMVDYDMNYGDIGGGSEVLMSDGSSYIPLEFYRSCPPPNQFYAQIIDLNWNGFNIFPPIPVDLSGGSYPTVQISYLPAGHDFEIELFHVGAKMWGRGRTGIVPFTYNPVDIKLGGYKNPEIYFSPDKPSVTYGSSTPAYLYWFMKGGWGMGGGMPMTTSNDTCIGPYYSTSYPSYVFSTPMDSQCTAEVKATDCRGVPVIGGTKVKIMYTCGNGSCEDFLDENNNNCKADCYCGDGYCYYGFENMDNCFSDCGY